MQFLKSEESVEEPYSNDLLYDLDGLFNLLDTIDKIGIERPIEILRLLRDKHVTRKLI